MLGAGFAYLLTQVKSFLQRQALIYVLVAAGGLIFIFAAGYGLDALRAMLMLRVGGVYASLIVGAGLLMMAFICIGAAIYLGRSPRPEAASVKTSSPYSNAPRRPLVTGKTMLAGGAVTGLVAGVLAAKRPWRHADHPSADADDERVRRAPFR
jgi:protein-S-isoprenylcysteine O-methyltransferase Ste14